MLVVFLMSLCSLDAPRLAVIRDAPAWKLTTQTGAPHDSAALRGRVVLVSFIFTTCSGSCPATTSRMVQVQQALKAKGHNGDLVSITLDPARDTPEKLQTYMKMYDVDPSNWSFLTGPPEQVNQVVAGWGMWAKPAANGQLDHPSRIFLVDKLGRIREIYDLTFLKPAWVVQDIELLLGEKG